MSSTEVFDSLRLNQAEVEHLMADLNRASSRSPMVSKRGLKRWPMPFQRSVLTTTSKLMGNMHCVAYPRNLTKRGAAVLSGAFVHPGTVCHLTLRAVNGKARSVAGVIRWCQHVKARAHDLGIEFSSPINPRDFSISKSGSCTFQLEHVEVTSLKGVVLVVDEDRLTHRLFQDILGASPVELVFAQSGEAGLKLLDQSPSLIVAERELPDMSGL
ncbi:MAG: response regulator, partial [Phycisphaerae bacterium]|nr:response regulator [Phycisphaerae bacterium]